MFRLTLGTDWIESTVAPADPQGQRSGRVISSGHSLAADDDRLDAAMDGVESLVLAHACAGIDVQNPRYAEGIRTCMDACASNL